MIEGFEEGLIGLNKSESKILELKFPEDYGKPDLAGKDVKFEVMVKEILENPIEKIFNSKELYCKCF